MEAKTLSLTVFKSVALESIGLSCALDESCTNAWFFFQSNVLFHQAIELLVLTHLIKIILLEDKF